MKFRKKPVVINAVKFVFGNVIEVRDFFGSDWSKVRVTNNGFVIPTLEGSMTAFYGDYIIRGVHGEYYSCKPDIFEETYEPVN